MFLTLLTTIEHSHNEMLETAIMKIGSGDKAALEQLYVATKNSVYAFVLSMLKSRHEAEDAFHDVYVSVYENAANYKPKGNPMGWILTIAKNRCNAYYRRVKKHTALDEVEELWSVDSDIEDRLVLESAFRTLTDEERSIIFLHLLSGQKHREIAALLDLPLPTVLSKYHRALKKLKAILEV